MIELAVFFRGARRCVVPVLVSTLLITLPGCKEKQRESVQATKASPTNAPQNVLDLNPPGDLLGESQVPVSAGDVAWNQLQEFLQNPQYPASWATNNPNTEEVNAFRRRYILDAMNQAHAFATNYPSHDQAMEARLHERRLLGIAVRLGETNQMARLKEMEASLLKNAALGEKERLEIRLGQLQREKLGDGETNQLARLKKLEEVTRTLRTEFPANPEVLDMTFNVAEGFSANGDFETARNLAKIVAEKAQDPKLSMRANGMALQISHVNKPLDLKFKAVDGREVDLAKMKGKVVLVDFWATWCGPCMKELPTVKETYEKLNPKGMEIVAISYDDDKDALLRLVQEARLPWPQFFDEAGDDAMQKRFGVMTIPTMWLVDKKGVLRDIAGVYDLAAKVERLLAEPN